MRVGILGGGQLGRMLALYSYHLGIDFRFFDSKLDVPVKGLAELINGDYEDFDLLDKFASGLDVVTYEFENVSLKAADYLAQKVNVAPHPVALEISRDRWREKDIFTRLSIPVAKYYKISSSEQLEQAISAIGLPGILKTRRMGYDGKGQIVVDSQSDLESIKKSIGGNDWIFEQKINFTRELSLVAVRDVQGQILFYPMIENVHKQGILRMSTAPAENISEIIQTQARQYAAKLMNEMKYCGVLTIEFFQSDENLLANEMAPRVHNSGHWTIEGAHTNNFENHIRAICGLPIGSTESRGYSVMLNILGDFPDIKRILQTPAAHYHSYAKTPRAARKIGHVIINDRDPKVVRSSLEYLIHNFRQFTDLRENIKAE